MSEAVYDPTTLRAFTFATWVFQLHVAGISCQNATIADLCAAIGAAKGAEDGDAAGLALVHAVRELIDGGEPQQMLRAARALYGERAADDLGAGDRTERTARIRKYQFTRNLPWLARIYERKTDGEVAPVWLLIEQVTDEVTAMDPNPWNGIDEERHLLLGDFQVLWELHDCACVYLH